MDVFKNMPPYMRASVYRNSVVYDPLFTTDGASGYTSDGIATATSLTALTTPLTTLTTPKIITGGGVGLATSRRQSIMPSSYDPLAGEAYLNYVKRGSIYPTARGSVGADYWKHFLNTRDSLSNNYNYSYYKPELYKGSRVNSALRRSSYYDRGLKSSPGLDPGVVGGDFVVGGASTGAGARPSQSRKSLARQSFFMSNNVYAFPELYAAADDLDPVTITKSRRASRRQSQSVEFPPINSNGQRNGYATKPSSPTTTGRKNNNNNNNNNTNTTNTNNNNANSNRAPDRNEENEENDGRPPPPPYTQDDDGEWQQQQQQQHQHQHQSEFLDENDRRMNELQQQHRPSRLDQTGDKYFVNEQGRLTRIDDDQSNPQQEQQDAQQPAQTTQVKTIEPLKNPNNIHEYLYALANKKDDKIGYAEQRKESIRRKSLWQTRGYRVEKERFQRFKENQGFGHDFLDPTHTKESSEQKLEKVKKRNTYGDYVRERNSQMFNKYQTEGYSSKISMTDIYPKVGGSYDGRLTLSRRSRISY